MSQDHSHVKRLIDTYVNAAGEPFYFMDPRWMLPGGLDPRIPTPVAMRDARLKELGARVAGIRALVAALGEKWSDDGAVARCTVLYDFNGARAEHYKPMRPVNRGRILQLFALILPVLLLALISLQFFAPSDEPKDAVGTIQAALLGVAGIGAFAAGIVAWRRRSNAIAWWSIVTAWIFPIVVSVPFVIIRN